MGKAEARTILVKKIRYKNNDTKYTVFTGERLRKKRNGTWTPTKKVETYVGAVFSVYPGDRLSVSVQMIENRIYGTQWVLKSYHRERPGTLDEIKGFLSYIPGLGPASVKKLIDKFGLDVLDTICKDGNALESVGIKKDACQKVRDEIVNNSYFEEILTFLQLNGLDYRYAFPIFKKYGLIAIRRMKDNPYSLYYDKLISFRAADKLNYKLKNPAGDDERFAAGLVASLRYDSESNGNLFVPYDKLKEILETFLNSQGSGFPKSSVPDQRLHDALSELIRARIIETDPVPSPQNPSVYLRDNHWAETQIVKTIKTLETEIKHFSYQKSEIDAFLQQYKPGNITLAPEQRDAVETALTSHISIITGGPGTGKTQTLNTMIAVIQKLSPKAVIKLCAPTGKAALRISELTNMQAATIHRTLKMGGYRTALQEGELECDFLIIDEFSMVDCFLCAKLFQAAAPYARIVIVGDYEQLPSVGPGLVLRDMIDSQKIPVTRLSTIFRQGKQSLIIKNANEVIKLPAHPTLTVNRRRNGEFYFFQNASVSRIQKTIQDSIHVLTTEYHMDPADIKVLSPLHNGDLGVDALNIELQNAFNPNGTPFEREDGLVIRKGDPVIHLHNNYDLDVFNGETGIVTDFGYTLEHTLLVTYPGNRHVWYNEEQVNELDLAYAMTTYKAQGSEFKAVILPVHESILKGLSKNLIYTGITRAKQIVILIGTKTAFSEGVRKSTIIQRNSNLAERLRQSL